MVNVNDENRAQILAALYNAAKPQGIGWLLYDPEDMTTEEAQSILGTGKRYFDYWEGRVMKVDLDKSPINFTLYDRDNGPGAGERACAGLSI